MRDASSRETASSAGPGALVVGSDRESRSAAESAGRAARRLAFRPRFRAIPHNHDRNRPGCSSVSRPRHAVQNVSWATSSLTPVAAGAIRDRAQGLIAIQEHFKSFGAALSTSVQRSESVARSSDVVVILVFLCQSSGLSMSLLPCGRFPS